MKTRVSLVALALIALASPAFAEPVPGVPDAVAPGLGLDQEPLEMAPNQCKPKDHFGFNQDPYWYGRDQCIADCTAHCQSNGGTVVSATFNARNPSCSCSCCAT